MNSLFRNIPLPIKLIALGLIPLLALVYFAIQTHQEKSERARISEELIKKIDQTAPLMTFISELQYERRLTLRSFLVNGKSDVAYIAQRQKVDLAAADLFASVSIPISEYKKITTYYLLEGLRDKIDRDEVSVQTITESYGEILARMHQFTATMETVPYLKEVSKELMSQKHFSNMSTSLGVMVPYIFHHKKKGSISLSEVADLEVVFGVFRSFESELNNTGSNDAVKSYEKIMAEGQLDYVLEYIEELIKYKQLPADTISAEQWWIVGARAIESIKDSQREHLKQAKQKATISFEREKKIANRNLFFVIAIITLVVLIVFTTIYGISASLLELKKAAEKMAEGSTGIAIPPGANDIIGTLAESIRKVDHSNLLLAESADAIGKGNFKNDIRPRSSKDLLGNALLKMQEDLKEYRRRSEEKNWIQAGINKVNDQLRGEKDMRNLCRDALTAMVSYSDLPVGVIYVTQSPGVLEFIAGYSITEDDIAEKTIPFGKTLLGEAAESKDVIELDSIPDHFIKIRTITGESSPRHILLVPLIHNGLVEGVLELGSFTPFKKPCHELVKSVSSHIATAIQSVKSRTRVQELLDQTQNQAEELRVQHSELENTNSELEAQTQSLQASEEELRVQQEELQQANSELEERTRELEEKNQLIVERNLEIQKKAEELELSSKYKSEFLANMSHELRTPLNSILLLSRLLSENNEKNLLQEQIEYAKVIQSSGQGLLTLIDEILDLSKIEAGRMTVEYSTIDIEDITSDLKPLFDPLAKQKNLELKFSIDPGTPKQIETDQIKLEQILKNLIANSLKFTHSGSIELNVKALNDHYLLFSVIDTGIGIPKEKQDLIFEAFQQADGSTRRKYGGTGLGLSISKQLVRLLQGDLAVKSEPGKGSTFTVKIPINRTEQTLSPEKEVETKLPKTQPELVAEKPESAPLPKGIEDDRDSISDKDKVILIVEDDIHFAKALGNFTRAKGYKIVISLRGEEAKDLALKYHPTGVLLDLKLPGKDGWQVMDELKADSKTRHIPVHIMSSMEAKKESRLRGAIDFINKPLGFDQMHEVFSKIEHVINKKNKKVLIIEDNEKHAQALAYYLGTFRINAEVAVGFNNASSSLDKKDVDCVILDSDSENKKLFEVLEEIKKNRKLEGLPVIVFTGKNMSRTESEKISQYADSIVVKTAHSFQRIMDEIALFLHLVEGNKVKSEGKKKSFQAMEEVLENKKVLIADDDVRNIFSLTKALENQKMKVLSAVDGKDALEILKKNPDIDIVLMDMMMPELDGYETTAKIRENPKFRDLPVIAVTAKAMTGDREKCIQAGASDYVSKPVDIDQLLSLLRVWLYDKA